MERGTIARTTFVEKSREIQFYSHVIHLVSKVTELGDIDQLAEEVQRELSALMPDYIRSKKNLGRTTVGASEMAILDFVPSVLSLSLASALFTL